MDMRIRFEINNILLQMDEDVANYRQYKMGFSQNIVMVERAVLQKMSARQQVWKQCVISLSRLCSSSKDPSRCTDSLSDVICYLIEYFIPHTDVLFGSKARLQFIIEYS